MQMNSMKLSPLAAAAALFGSMVASAALAQATYPDPLSAGRALVEAVRKSDHAALRQVLGPRWQSLRAPGGADKADVAAFLKAADEQVKVDRGSDGKVAHLTFGKGDWVLPIPLAAQAAGGWRFDIDAAHEEVAVRRIGRNELSTMQAMLAFVDAQREYAQADHNGDGVLEYARKLVSSPGKRDGLIWDARLGESALGPQFAPAKPGAGYHGYRFRLLTSQGPSAPGGARDYTIGGRLLSGFALIGWPVQYGETGVMTFVVNHEGKLVERDLGPRTPEVVAQILRYEPDAGWTPVKP
jgi:hypothetical protein